MAKHPQPLLCQYWDNPNVAHPATKHFYERNQEHIEIDASIRLLKMLFETNISESYLQFFARNIVKIAQSGYLSQFSAELIHEHISFHLHYLEPRGPWTHPFHDYYIENVHIFEREQPPRKHRARKFFKKAAREVSHIFSTIRRTTQSTDEVSVLERADAAGRRARPAGIQEMRTEWAHAVAW